MSFKVVWEPAAVDLSAGFLADDPDGLRAVFEAVDLLTDQPRPSNVFPLGSSNLYRLRIGRYRVVYEVDDTSHTLKIRHVGRRSQA